MKNWKINWVGVIALASAVGSGLSGVFGGLNLTVGAGLLAIALATLIK